MNSKNTITEFQRECVGKKIVCFGAGKMFEHAFIELLTMDLQPAWIVDNNSHKWGGSLHGIEIKAPADMTGQEDIVVYITNKFHQEEIKEQIGKICGIKIKTFTYPLECEYANGNYAQRNKRACLEMYSRMRRENTQQDCSAQELLQKWNETKNQFVIPRIPLMLTTRCTLCCEQCNNLMPYYTRPKDYNVTDVMTWMDHLLAEVDELLCMELVGGEPFLYRNLEEILGYVLNQNKIERVELTTNGSIVPKDSILELLRNEKVIVKISDYNGKFDLNRLISALENKKIRYLVHRDMVWTKVGGVQTRGRNENELLEQALRCESSKECRTILNGKLYICSRAASLAELEIVPDLECVDLTDTDDLRNRLKHFFETVPCNACNYCDNYTAQGESVEPAVQKRR